MAESDLICLPEATEARVFATTHWSVVRRASSVDSSEALKALEALCCGYWEPIYFYLRGCRHSHENAQDLTQGFFQHLLQKRSFARAQPEKGRFRSFLLGALKKFVSDEEDKTKAQKRGGGCCFISIDAQAEEEWFRIEPSDRSDPEKLYERSWASALLKHVLARLKSEYEAAGKGAVFEQLKGFLGGEKKGRYSEAGAEIEMTKGAVATEMCRMRKRFRTRWKTLERL